MSSPALRTHWVDALRGVAVVWMVAYHFCFDLSLLGFAHFAMLSDPWWTAQRSAIVTLFMLSAGVSQVLAWRAGQSVPAFWRRWAQIAGCSVGVSVATWWMFGSSWIYFGVLHAMAVSWLITRFGLMRGVSLPMVLVAAMALLSSAWWVPAGLAGSAFSGWGSGVQTVLNSPLGSVLGWVSLKPVTEDYVPLAPWLGVLWLGVAWGLWLQTKAVAVAQSVEPNLPRSPQWLRWLGRHSLLVYMVHQPVLLGGLQLLQALQR